MFIRSNLCSRHIPDELTPRGHHDWPNKRLSVYRLPGLLNDDALQSSLHDSGRDADDRRGRFLGPTAMRLCKRAIAAS
jgi:hypothetical protein